MIHQEYTDEELAEIDKENRVFSNEQLKTIENLKNEMSDVCASCNEKFEQTAWNFKNRGNYCSECHAKSNKMTLYKTKYNPNSIHGKTNRV